MTLQQLHDQLEWLLDQLAAVHESYSSSGNEGTNYTAPGGAPITQGEYIWRLSDRIASTRIAITCREEIAAAQE